MRAGLLFGAAALAACQRTADEPAIPAVQLQESASAVDTAAPPSRENVRLEFAPDGLLRIPSQGNPPQMIAFGTARDTVENLAERAWGPASGRSDNDECGAGPMAFSTYGGLTLNFQGDRFVGWYSEDARTATVDGVAAGIVRAELEKRVDVSLIADSTLEGEFEMASLDGASIGGFLTGEGPTAVVTALYGGTTCFFR